MLPGALVALSLASGISLAGAVPASSTNGCPTAAAPTVGDGVNSPYEISSGAELQWLNENSPHWGDDFILTADISLAGCTWTSTIGDAATPFTGTFDGDGFAITDVTVEVDGDYALATQDGMSGFFGNLGAGAQVRDLSVAGTVVADITGQGTFAYAGGIAGIATQATLENVDFEGTVSATALDPQSDTEHALAGGIVGSASGVTLLEVSSSAAVSAVSDGRPSAGGLLGYANNSSAVTDSWSVGSVLADGDVQSTAGGLVGVGTDLSVERSFSGSAVTTMPSFFTDVFAGGIAGIASGRIVDSYARGPIWGVHSAGGIVGQIDVNSPLDIDTSYFSGPLGVRLPSASVGGVSGSTINQTGNLNFGSAIWNAEISGIATPVGRALDPTWIVNPPVTGAVGETTSRMTTMTTFVDSQWNISATFGSAVWGMCAGYNDGYPYLTSLLAADPCSAGAAPSITSAPQSFSGTAGTAVSTNPLATVGFTGNPIFTVTPALPPGLSMDPVTGAVSGTLQDSGPQRSFTITATVGSPWQQASIALTQTSGTPGPGQISEFPEPVSEAGAFQSVATRPGDGYTFAVSFGNVAGSQGVSDRLLGYLVDASGAVVAGPLDVAPPNAGMATYSQPAVAHNPVTNGWLVCYPNLVAGQTQPTCQYLNPNGTRSGAPFALRNTWSPGSDQMAIAFNSTTQDFLVAASAANQGPIVRFVDGAGGGAVGAAITVPTSGNVSPIVRPGGGLGLAFSEDSGTFGLVIRGRENGTQDVQAPWFYHLGADGIPTRDPQRLRSNTSLELSTGSIAYDRESNEFMVVAFDFSTSGSPLVARSFDAALGAADGDPVETAIDGSVFSIWGYRPVISAGDDSGSYTVVTTMADNSLGIWAIQLDADGAGSQPSRVSVGAPAATGNRPQISFNRGTCEYVVTYSLDTPDWGWQLFSSTAPAVCAPAAPLNPWATAGDASATISWQAPSDPGSSAVLSYEVVASPGGATCSATAPDVSCTVPGLTNGSSYTFKVRARNGIGWSPLSTPTSAISPSGSDPAPNPPAPAPQEPPSAPRNVSAIPGVESAIVSWVAPSSSGTFPVTSYEVTASPGEHSCLVSAPALTCTITGLTPGESYTFVAKAYSSVGWSGSSATSNAVVPEAAPVDRAILITSSRDRVAPSIVRVDGSTTGLVGAEVTPYVRKAGQTSYVPGVNVRTVDADGRFTWQRKSGKRLYVYFTSGEIRSNRLIVGRSVP
jgi:hypothetical protein